MRPPDKDLLYIHSQVGVKVSVHDDIYELIGEISSNTDSDGDDRDVELEEYFTTNLSESLSQVMAQTKQTERKSEENRQRYPPARKNPQRDDSDSSIEAAARAQESEPMGRLKSPRSKSSGQSKPSASTGFTSGEDSTSGGSGWRKRKHVESDGDSGPESSPPKKTGTGMGKHRKLLNRKPLHKTTSRTPQKGPTMKEMTREWNRTGRIGLKSETTQGWLKKTTKK